MDLRRLGGCAAVTFARSHGWAIAALLIWGALTGALWFVCDDAFISFRYGRNLATGHGLVFNPGEQPPIEGYSNLLWVLLSALVEAVGATSRVVVPVVSAGIGAALIVGVWRRLDVPPAAAGAAILTLAAPAFAVWSSSGLETMAFAALLFATAQSLWRGGSTGACVAFAVGLVAVRTEGALWALWVVALALWIADDRALRRRAALVAGAVIAVAVAQAAFRWGWHADLVSAPARVKVALGAWSVLRGGKYLASYYLTCPVALGALVVSLGAIRGSRADRAALLTAWAFPAYAVLVGGDFLPYGRLLVPGMAFTALAVGRSLADVRWAAPAGALAAAVGLLPVLGFDPLLAPFRDRLWFRLSDPEVWSEQQKLADVEANTEDFAMRGRALAATFRPGDAIVSGAVGAIGYYGDVVVFDVFGLVDREVALRPGPTGSLVESPGHDKRVSPLYFLPRNPRVLYSTTVRGVVAAGRMKETLERWDVPEDVQQRYLPDFEELPPMMGREGVPLRVFLLVVRRAQPGEDARKAWNAFPARRRALNAELRQGS